MTSLFTSESVTEGHPDKVCDLVADAILDAHVRLDRNSRVAVEVLCKGSNLVIAGEINSRAEVDFESVARLTVAGIGYTSLGDDFCDKTIKITNLIGKQSERISGGVDLADRSLGAGDQGMVFGYATLETEELMPVPIMLAHRITRLVAERRRSGEADFFRPDGKSQVTVLRDGGRTVEVHGVVVSAHHRGDTGVEQVRDYVIRDILPEALGKWYTPDARVLVNPAGPFDIGGPVADCGVTGRKIIVDTYGGAARHGGGGFSGKDATKVDRSGAYFARFVARQIVLRGIATEAEVQVAYAIGVHEPVAVTVDTRGTGSDRVAEDFARRFDFRPAAIIERLGLDQPGYTGTTNYGHFGKPELSWEL